MFVEWVRENNKCVNMSCLVDRVEERVKDETRGKRPLDGFFSVGMRGMEKFNQSQLRLLA